MSISLPSSPTPRAAAPGGELRLEAWIYLAMLIRLLLALLGRETETEVVLPAATTALIREAARAVAMPAWAQRTPRAMFNRTFGAQYICVPLRCLIGDGATARACAGEIARPVTAGGPCEEVRQPRGLRADRRIGRTPAVLARRRGPPPRASPRHRRRGAPRCGRPTRGSSLERSPRTTRTDG